MELDNKTALLIIDVQKSFDELDDLEKSNPEFKERILDVLTLWRARGWSVFHARIASTDPFSPNFIAAPGYPFSDLCAPLAGESVIEREVDSAFLNTPLGSLLRMEGCERLLVCGARSQLGVDATVRHASSLGFDVSILEEGCCATALTDHAGKTWPADYVRRLTMGIMGHSYANIVSIRDVMAAL